MIKFPDPDIILESMDIISKLEKLDRKILNISACIVAVLVVLIFGVIIGVTYPNWYNSLPFKNSLPAFLKPAQTVESTKTVTIDGRKIIRTSEDSAVIDVVKKASPAVVSIVTKTVSFDPSLGSVQNQQGIGTGFIVDPSGIVITNNHVVCDSSISYTVVTNDGKNYDVKKIDLDPANDIAILRIAASNLPTLQLGNSDPGSLVTGQTVIAIGNALGQFQNSVTVGVVSGLGRGITAGGTDVCGNGQTNETLQNVIQTDAALNPGNSGGPLLDLSGNVVGVNFATSTSAQNIGFVIPINRVKTILDQYRQNGRIVRPYIGIAYQIIDSSSAQIQNVPQGAFVSRVVPGSPADKGGIQAGDIVTKFDNQAVSQSNDLVTILDNLKVGQKAAVEVYRDNKTVSLSVTLTENPSP